jgi:hypothetical protein
MRNISAAAMTQLATARGGEPLIIVEIFWNGVNGILYCDRGAFQNVPLLQGKILELGNLEDVVALNGSTASQAITIKLDDIDQSIKNIYNTIDIHKKLVNVYQWFSQLNFNDKFIIFEGYINSPIVWSEKDRTVSFEVVSKVEDQEIGFSAEEGDFPSLPDDLIGKPWPLPFGAPLKVPALRLDIVSSAVLMDSFGLHDPALDAQLFNLNQQEGVASTIATVHSLQAADVQLKANADAENAFSLAQDALDTKHQVTAAQDQAALDFINNQIAAITGAGGQPSQALLDQQTAAYQKIQDDQAAADAEDQANAQKLQDAISKAAQVNLDTNNKILKDIADKNGTIEKDKARVSHQLSQELSFEQHSKELVLFNGHTFPQGQSATIEVGPLIITGSISARNNGDGRGDSILHVEKIARKVPVRYSYSGGQIGLYNFYGKLEIDRDPTPVQIQVQGGGFAFIKAGTAIKWLSPLPTRYIAAMLPCTVVGVYAIRDFNQTKLLTCVPSGGTGDTLGNITAATPFGEVIGGNQFFGVNTALAGFKAGDNILTPGTGLPNNHYYDVSIQQFGDYDVAPFLATVITLVRPLTYWDEGWEDAIYVDLISPVGPNTVDIIVWLIETYTHFGIDSASFSTVRSQLANFQSDFALFDRKNIIQALAEIAYQARCAIWLKNRVFFMKYLVAEPTPVDTITLDDIIFGSLELDHTSTESLVTKLIATYRIDYGPLRDSEKGSGVDKVILRNNQAKYGLHQQNYDWYSYTNPGMVDLAATFWIIRKSNTWKLVKFKTPLHKLKLESFDAVTINLAHNWVCNGAVTGLVESTHLNSDTMEIEFQVWMPVRLGEMTKYNFAWPPDSTFFFYPTVVDQPGSGGPGITASGDLTSTRPSGGTTFPMDKGIRGAIDHGNPHPGSSAAPPNSTPRPLVTPMGPLDPTTDPGFQAVQLTPADPVTGLPPNTPAIPPQNPTAISTNNASVAITFPATILSQSKKIPGTYNVDAYLQGVDNDPTAMIATDASFDSVDNPAPVASGTTVMVSQLNWAEGDVKAATEAQNAFLKAQQASQVAQANLASAIANYNSNKSDDNAQAVQTATQAAQEANQALKDAATAYLAAQLVAKTAFYFVPGSAGASTFPGVVTGGSGSGPYTCNIYIDGMSEPPTSIAFVKQLQITGDNVPSGTWALIARGIKTPSGDGTGPNGGPNSAFEYTMQVPVWVG